MAMGERFRELARKYGKVALGVHLSVSAVSIAGLYAAVRNNVDVEALFRRVGIPSGTPGAEGEGEGEERNGRNRTAELAASGGGALAVAVLLNKALFPVRVPITVAFTPPIARFLARRKIIKSHVGSHQELKYRQLCLDQDINGVGEQRLRAPLLRW